MNSMLTLIYQSIMKNLMKLHLKLTYLYFLTLGFYRYRSLPDNETAGSVNMRGNKNLRDYHAVKKVMKLD